MVLRAFLTLSISSHLSRILGQVNPRHSWLNAHACVMTVASGILTLRTFWTLKLQACTQSTPEHSGIVIRA